MSTEEYSIGYADGKRDGYNEGVVDGHQAATTRHEAKIKALVEALEAGPSLMHTYPDKSECLCSHCEFIRLKNAAIEAAKETS